MKTLRAENIVKIYIDISPSPFKGGGAKSSIYEKLFGIWDKFNTKTVLLIK